MNLETYIIQQRRYCESPNCMAEAKACRDVDGRKVVYCWNHDPETVQSFSAWLDQQGDSMPEPTSFSEWLSQNGDSI